RMLHKEDVLVEVDYIKVKLVYTFIEDVECRVLKDNALCPRKALSWVVFLHPAQHLQLNKPEIVAFAGHENAGTVPGTGEDFKYRHIQKVCFDCCHKQPHSGF